MIWAPQGKSTNRVLRGGAWNNHANNARCADRNNNTPSDTNNNIGFRCLRRIRECVSAFQAEPARPRPGAATDPKAHLLPPVSAPRGNEPGKGAGAGSALRKSRRRGLSSSALQGAAPNAQHASRPPAPRSRHPGVRRSVSPCAAALLGALVLLLGFVGKALATFGQSNVFAFDTRDSNTAH